MLLSLFVLCAVTSHTRPVASETYTVGDGSPESCTYEAFKAVIDTADADATLDTVVFDCGEPTSCDNSVSITLEEPVWVNYPLLIDGSTGSNGRIKLDGQEKYRHFIVAFESELHWGIRGEYHTGDYDWKETTLSLSNLILVNGGTPLEYNTLQMGERPGWGSPTANWVTKGDGGCIYLGSNGELTISSVDFTNCRSEGTPVLNDEPLDTRYRGGAIYTSQESKLTISDSTFCDSYATEEGGAIFAAWNTERVDISNSIFYRGIADGDNEEGGGAIMLHDTDAYIDSSVFAENEGHLGGAIRVLLADLLVTNSVFHGNRAVITTGDLGECCARGGAIYVDGAGRTRGTNRRVSFDSSVFEENSSGGRGGAIYMCLYDSNSDSSAISNTLFNSNEIGPSIVAEDLPRGAALHHDCSGYITWTNTEMTGNSVASTEDYTVDEKHISLGSYVDESYEVLGSGNLIPGWTTSDESPIDHGDGETSVFDPDTVQCGGTCYEDVSGPTTTDAIATSSSDETTASVFDSESAEDTTEEPASGASVQGPFCAITVFFCVLSFIL